MSKNLTESKGRSFKLMKENLKTPFLQCNQNISPMLVTPSSRPEFREDDPLG